MLCEQVQLELPAYLHGKMGPEERAAMEGHLSACPVCAGEASAMRQVGERLSDGLKQWVEQGVCPDAVMARIEARLTAGRRRPWWRNWTTVTGAAAAAVLLLLVLTRSEQLGQMATLVGGLASQLVAPEAGVRPVQERVADGVRILKYNLADEHDGIHFRLHEVALGEQQSRIHISIRGRSLDPLADAARYAPVLHGPMGPVALRHMEMIRGRGEVVVHAAFEPIPSGQDWRLVLQNLPRQAGGETAGTWEIGFTN